MKKFSKVILAVTVLLFSVATLASCFQETKVKKVGILQLVTHAALDNARIGFEEKFAEEAARENIEFEFVVRNPEADDGAMNQMATELVRSCDIVLGIATDAAIALQSAAIAEGKENLPILFTAVTDAVSAGLVASNEAPGANITGTIDINPVAEQILLMKTLKPSIQKFGIIYNVSEVNSKVQADLAIAAGKANGLEGIVKTVSAQGEIEATVRELIRLGAEAIFLPTDNLIAANVPAVTMVTEEENIPTICGESSLVENGGTVTYGIDYLELGKQTASMAIKVLKGAKPAELPVEAQPESNLAVAYSARSFAAIGLEIPQSIKDKGENVDK